MKKTFQWLLAGAILSVAGTPVLWARETPPHDDFESAQLISGAPVQVTGDSSTAKREAHEPDHAGQKPRRSLWYRWTAPDSASVTIDTVGSDFNTVLAIYTGNSLRTLANMAANDDLGASVAQSRVTFSAIQGTEYKIAVDGIKGDSGKVVLNLKWAQGDAPPPPPPPPPPPSAPPHDNLGSARVISGASSLDSSSNLGATKEAGEPNHAGNAGGASVWYQWTAPTSGNVTFSTEGSGFNTLLAVYTGNNYADLVPRHSNDDIGAGNPQSSVTFEAVIAVTYLIAVDGFNGVSGNIVLQWNLTALGPANDHFSAAILLQGSAGAAYAATVGATQETGEPNHGGNAGGASVWYQWTAPSANPVTFDTVGSTFDTLLAVYTGSSLSALTVVAQNNNDGASPQSRVAFTPVLGTAYRIAVDGNNGAVGNLALNWSQSGTGPANDQFANALVISNGNGQATASSINATKEAGEPNHAGASGGASIWFSWTAPASGLMIFETLGSSFDTLLAVYTGSSLSGLTSIASNSDISADDQKSRVQFNAVMGATYQIAVDGFNGASGSVKLNWNSGAMLPDLIVWPNTTSPAISNETFSASSCAVMEELITAGTHRLLRFTTETRNTGAADLDLGSPAGNPLFEYASCHGHYHLYNYMSYRLLDGNGQVVNSGFKTGFCLMDSTRWDANASSAARYDCSNQGLQKGWSDLYLARLDGQWIVIDGVPDGYYYLEMTVNPFSVLQESDYSNNTAVVPVKIGNPPNDNDQFASAQVLDPNFTTASSFNVGASAESGEPSHAGITARRSVWFKWRPASNQAVTIDTVGSTFDTALAVYTGTSLTQLTPVASNDDISHPDNVQSRVSFTAASGVDYMIAVDGYDGASGDIQLNRALSGAAPQELAALPPALIGSLPSELVPALEYTQGNLGELKFTIRGGSKKVYLIEVSTDLVNWYPVTTTLATSAGHGFFSDKSNAENHRAVPPNGHVPPVAHADNNHQADYYPPLFFRIVLLDKENRGRNR